MKSRAPQLHLEYRFYKQLGQAGKLSIDILYDVFYCTVHLLFTDIIFNVVTTIKLWWLATTEPKPTPPSRCFTVCSAVFLGAVS